jgi:hypothetical protein
VKRKGLYIVILMSALLLSVNLNLPPASAQSERSDTPLVARASSIAISPGRHIFSDVLNGAPSAFKTFTISNTTDDPLTVSELRLTGTGASQFIPDPTNLATPFTIPAGLTQNVRYAFNAFGVAGPKFATLEVITDAAPVSVKLNGLALVGLGGNLEPSLQWILDTFEIQTRTGDDNPATTTIHSSIDTASGAAPISADEVIAQSFTAADGSVPVTVEVLASFGNNPSNTTVPVAYAGFYRTGQFRNKSQLFAVNNGSHQTLLPVVTGNLSVMPPGYPFGFYSVWSAFSNREVFTEDKFNDWEANTARRHKVRTYPLIEAGAVVPNTYIFATEEFTGTATTAHTTHDFNDVVYIVRNITPATTLASGLIDFENLDWQRLNAQKLPGTYWFNTWLSFSGIGHIPPRNGNWKNLRSHNLSTLRIHNRSTTAPLSITQMTINNPVFAFGTPPLLPMVIQPGTHIDVPVRFIEGPNNPSGSRTGKITIITDAANQPVAEIGLGALYQTEPEGSNEVDVSYTAAALGLKSVTMPIPQGQWKAAGEEILSKYWQRLDQNYPMYARQVAAYHGCCSDTAGIQLDFTAENDAAISPAHHPDYGQSLHPLNLNYPGPPVDMYKFTEGVFNTTATNSRNGQFELVFSGRRACSGPCNNNHGVRWWPLRDSTGKLVTGMYIVSMDYVGGTGVNYDYNDNTVLIANVRPSLATPLPVDVMLTGTDTPDPVTVNADLTYNFTISNRATVPADNIRLDLSLPSNATFVSLYSPQSPTCDINMPSISCGFRSLEGEQSYTITIVLRPNAGPVINTTATVSTGNPDTIPANNTFVLSTQVQGSTAQPGTITVIKDADLNTSTVFNFATTGGLTPANFSLIDGGTTPSVNVKVNFQDQTSEVPFGYLRDYGQGYGQRISTNQGGGQYTYGWVDPTANNAPISLIGNGRDRARNSDQRYDTLIHMQANNIKDTFSGVKRLGRWEIALPVGRYRVTVAVGDPINEPLIENTSYHSMSVEGVKVINRFQSTGVEGSASRHQTTSVDVTVSDGRLTLDAGDGFNTKINFVDIVSIPGNIIQFTGVSPAIYTIREILPQNWLLNEIYCIDPTGDSEMNLTTAVATLNLGSGENITCTFLNRWNTAVGTPTPTQTIAPTSTSTPVNTNTPTATSATSGTIQIVKEANPKQVEAFQFAATGLTPASFTLADDTSPQFNLKINFQNAGAPVPGGYLRDFGQPYGQRSDVNQGNGQYTYGWINYSTGAPLDLSNPGNGRDRNVVTDQRLDTLIHMQANDIPGAFTGVKTEGIWEIAIPNGVYRVTVAAGDAVKDANTVNEPSHTLNVEGVNAFTQYKSNEPTGSTLRHITAAVHVVVRDGKLTIDAGGTAGYNTKINYVDIDKIGNTITFVNVLPGSYSVSELSNAAGWSLSNIVCTDTTDTTVNPGTQTANIVLSAGEFVRCTFINGGPTLTPTLIPSQTPSPTLTPSLTPTNTATLTNTPTPAPPACAPISTLGCAYIERSLPFSLNWNFGQSGLAAGTGGNTGFTMAAFPSARNTQDGIPTFSAASGYEPSSISVKTGSLFITSRSGEFFRRPPTVTANRQINALGVGFNYTGSDVLRIETTVIRPAFNTDGVQNFEQGGIWLGLDEDNYIKLVVQKNNTAGTQARIQMSVERYGQPLPGTITLQELNTGNAAPGTSPLNSNYYLLLELDRVNGVARGYYSVNGGALTQVVGVNANNGVQVGDTQLTIPSTFFAGVDHDANPATNRLTFAGLFGTHRASTKSIEFQFQNFSIAPYIPPTATPTITASFTPSETPTASQTPTATLTLTPSNTPTDTMTFTPTETPTPQPTSTSTVVTATAVSPTETLTPVSTSTSDVTATATNTPVIPIETLAPTSTSSVVITATSTPVLLTETLMPTSTSEVMSSATPTQTVVPTNTAAPTPTVPVNGIDLLVNGGFEERTGQMPMNWTPKNLSAKDRVVCNKQSKQVSLKGSCAFRFKFDGDTNAKRQIRQNIVLSNGVAGDTFILTAHAAAKNLTGGASLRLRVVSVDGTKEKIRINLPVGSFDYTLFTRDLTITATPSRIRVSVQLNAVRGRLFVDDVRLSWVSNSTSVPMSGDLIPLPLAP